MPRNTQVYYYGREHTPEQAREIFGMTPEQVAALPHPERDTYIDHTPCYRARSSQCGVCFSHDCDNAWAFPWHDLVADWSEAEAEYMQVRRTRRSNMRRFWQRTLSDLIARRGNGTRLDKTIEWLFERTGLDQCSNCGGIADDCGCWCCPSCGEWYSPGDGRCPNCDRCEHCCACSYCERCGERSRHVCPDCERCDSCSCECGDSDAIPWRDVRRGSHRFHGDPSPRYPRFVGVEIECGMKGPFDKLTEAVDRWSVGVHTDGSISGRCGEAAELSTAPARGEAFEKQIKDVCAGLAEAHGKVDASCGLHVHVDVRDYSPREVLAFTRLIEKVEPALYDLVAPSRRDNQYCGEWGEKFSRDGVWARAPRDKKLKKLDASIYGSVECAEEVKRNPYKHECRYHGINFNAMVLYGTIEFRLHHGTVNERKILMWSAVCSALIEWASKHGEREAARLMGDPATILERIVKDREVVAWIKARREHFAKKISRRHGSLSLGETVRPDEGPIELSETQDCDDVY